MAFFLAREYGFFAVTRPGATRGFAPLFAIVVKAMALQFFSCACLGGKMVAKGNVQRKRLVNNAVQAVRSYKDETRNGRESYCTCHGGVIALCVGVACREQDRANAQRNGQQAQQ